MVRWSVALLPYPVALGLALFALPATPAGALDAGLEPDAAERLSSAPVTPLEPARLALPAETPEGELTAAAQPEKPAIGIPKPAPERRHGPYRLSHDELQALEKRVKEVTYKAWLSNGRTYTKRCGSRWLKEHRNWVRNAWACCPEVPREVMLAWFAAVHRVAAETALEEDARWEANAAPAARDRFRDIYWRDYGERLGDVTGRLLYDAMRADERARFAKLRMWWFAPAKTWRGRPPLSVREYQALVQQLDERSRERVERDRRQYLNAHPDLPAHLQAAVRDGEVAVGMHLAAVELSRYDDRSRAQRRGGPLEMVMYRRGEPDELRLTFKDRIVTRIERTPRKR